METNTVTVFFYGLFMDEALLASKGVRARTSANGYVDGFGLRIGDRATLVPDEGSRAYGVVMEITPEDAAALYSEDSVADYVPESVTAILSSGHEMPAVSYNLPATRLAGTNPDYASALLDLATRLGFPSDYLDQIRQMAASQ